MRNPFENEERAAFRKTLRDFVKKEIIPHADDWDEAGEIPWELHQKTGALGVWGFGIDEKYGGLGFDDVFMRAAYNEEFAKSGAGGVGAAMGGRSISIEPIHRLASEEIKERVIPEVVSGRKGSSLGVTEPGGGSDVAAMKTNARRDGNHFVINGSKTFITGGMKSDYFVIPARTGGEGLSGISLFLVEAAAPGFSRTPLPRKMGWWSSDQATLYFDECRVPAENMMGEENAGFIAIMENFNYERIGMVAGMLGMMKACLEDSIAWAQERQTFGKPMIRSQVIRHKIADMSAKIDAVEALLNQICWQVNEGDIPVAEISKAKFFSTKALEFCASEAMQIFGGAGYMADYPIERFYRDVRLFRLYEGTSEIQKIIIAKAMIRRLKQS